MKYISRPLAILAFIAATILPLAVILISVFYRDGEFVISESLESLQSKRIALVTLTNVGLALAATVLSAALAIPAAWLSSRTNTPFAKWFLYVAAVPFLIPSHTVAYAWMQFMEVIGKVIHGSAGHPLLPYYNMPFCVLVLALYFFPIIFYGAFAAFRSTDPLAENAALVYQGFFKVFRRVTLPSAMPYLFGSIALAGLLIFSEYGIPAMLTVNTFVGELFAFMSGFLSASNAIVFSFLMFIIILVVGWFVFRKIPVTYFFSGKQSTHRHQTFKMRGWLKGISSAYVLLTFTLVVVVPFAALVIRAFSLTGDPKADGEIFSGFKYFLEGLEYGEQDFKTTLITAPLSAVLATIIALPIARMLAFTVKRIKYMLFVFVAMTFVIPATIFGIGVLMIYNLPMFDAIYDTPLIIVFTYVGMFTPIAVLIVAAGMMRVGTREEFVARLHGVGNFTAYTDIFLPRIGFEFALAFLAVLVFSMAELGATALIMPPGSSPITTGLYIMMHYGNEERVSAIALMQIMLVFIPVIMFVNVRVLLKLARRNNG